MQKYAFKTLPETLYFRSNCLSECRQQQMIKYCNCTIDLLYPAAGYPKCNISSLKCLYIYNCKHLKTYKLIIAIKKLPLALFNYEKPPTGHQYFPDDEEGFICDCLPECESIEYGFNISPIKRIS